MLLGTAADALAEVALDVAEGADIVMVKPALPYLSPAVADAGSAYRIVANTRWWSMTANGWYLDT